MTGLLLALISSTAAGNIVVAAPGLTYVDVTPQTGELLLDFFGEKLVATGGIEIVTQAQVAQLIGLERQRALAGCGDDSSTCMTELSGALGADVLLSGSLGRLGGSFTITLKLLDTKTGKPLASATTRAANEDALQTWLAEQAVSMGAALRERLRGAALASVGATRSSSSPLRLVSFVAGGAFAVGSGICFGLSGVAASRLKTLMPAFTSEADIRSVQRTGDLEQTLGIAFAAVAAAALVVGVVLLVLGGDP